MSNEHATRANALALSLERILSQVRSTHFGATLQYVEDALVTLLEQDESLRRVQRMQDAAAVAGQLAAALDAVWKCCAASLPDEVRAQVVAAIEAWEGSTEEEV